MTTTTPITYWKPEDGERQLRIFISHRYDDDQELYDNAVTALIKGGFPVQNISLSKSQLIRGPRGGYLPELKVQAEIAARIYTSDILIAPSRPGVSRSDWVTWEVQLAAVGYGIPILFVNFRGQQRKTRLVTEIESLGLPCEVCEPEAHSIARSVAELVRKPRPDWTVRRHEPDSTVRFRGPAALDDVLNKFPLQSRYAEVALPQQTSRKWRFWPPFSSRDRHP